MYTMGMETIETPKVWVEPASGNPPHWKHPQGRPFLPDGEAKRAWIKVYMTPAELERIMDAKGHETLSSWMRRIALGACKGRKV